MNLRLDARDRSGWRIATMDVARKPTGFDSTAQGMYFIDMLPTRSDSMLWYCSHIHHLYIYIYIYIYRAIYSL